MSSRLSSKTLAPLGLLALAACLLVNCPAAAQPAAPAAPAAAPARPADPLAQAWVRLRSLSLADTLDWVREHGPSVLFTLIMVFAILSIANRVHSRVVRLLTNYAHRGNPLEQENRARTLVGVLHNALRIAVITLGCLMLLEEVGIPIAPLLGGVAVVGLAVAFGAQSLIKDYFTGFLILLEQQYMIGDVIKIGAVTGQVEQITLRVTVVRDIDGAVHFIPHGQINIVSNLTHGWSQAVFDMTVATSEPVERVHNLFFELAGELRRDAEYGPMILADPVMLGVESLADATFVIKFCLRTLPLKRWDVRRELLRRIKAKFQELGIKVSVP